MLLDKQVLAVPTLGEVIAAFTDWSANDYALVLGIVLFGALLAVPLSQVDRRDTASGFTYIAYCLAGGVAMILALPKKLGSVGDAGMQVVVVLLLITVAGVRWNMRKPETIREVDTDAKPKLPVKPLAKAKE